MNRAKKRGVGEIFPFLLMAGLIILIDGLALSVISPFEAAGMSVFENPDDPLNIVYLFLTILVFTAAILLISKFLKKILVQGIILVAVGFVSFSVFYPLLAAVFSELWSVSLSMAATAVLVVMLVKYPEWYVIDTSSIIVGAGSIAMLGISLNILLVIVLLIGLAVYDAISVYKTKHMIDLADTVLELRSPIMLVIPKIRNYSQMKETRSLKEELREGEERKAFLMGLGDFVFPGILVASTFYNITNNGLLIALSVMLGTLLGFTPLAVHVSRGKPQAGLPYLCSGAILGYIVSSYLLFGQLVGLT